MNLGELRAEVKARGFDDIPDARIDRWINQSIREINDAENWWWLDTVATGTMPFEIEDLRTVLYVYDIEATPVKLQYSDLRDIADRQVLDTPGKPTHYFLEQQTVYAFPRALNELSVRYLSTGADLSVDADVPTIPVAYHDLIVNGAVRKAYLDSDEFEAANMMRQELALGLEQMRASQLDRQDDGNDRIILVDTWL